MCSKKCLDFPPSLDLYILKIELKLERNNGIKVSGVTA